MITLRHVYKTYGSGAHALSNVTFEIAAGEFVFLTGPSGAGKTTLFKLVSGFDIATSGSVNVAGFEVSEISPSKLHLFRRRIGVVYQDFRLLKNLSVFENIALPLRVRGDRNGLITRKVSAAIEQVGLSHKWDTLTEFLSGGEQQRVAIARALVHQPAVIIADEPTGNLDPDLTEEVIDLFELASAQGTTVLVATHDVALVERRRKRCLHLDMGVLHEPAHVEQKQNHSKETSLKSVAPDCQAVLPSQRDVGGPR